MSKTRTGFWKKILGLLLVASGLGVFVLGNWFFRTYMTNFDERDHMAAGFLMSKGWVLYRDIFSHHFPVPYYWVKMWDFLWVDQIASRGVSMFRTTLNIYYALCALLVLVSVKNIKNKIFFVLYLISTVLLMPLFHGNILLSETFGFFPILMVIWLLFSSFVGDLVKGKITAVVSALLCGLGFWSQPLLIPCFVIPLLYLKKEIKTYILACVFIIIAPLILFWINGSLVNFWQMGIWFNYAVYPKYYYDIEGVKPGFAGMVNKMLYNQLLMMFRPDISNNVLVAQFIGNWFISLVAIYLAYKKKYKFLIGLAVSFLALRIREVKIVPGALFNFGVLPFMMGINLLFMGIIYSIKGSFKFLAMTFFVIYMIFIYKAAEPIVKQSFLSGFNYHIFWSDRQTIGDEMARLATKDETVLVYPHDVDLYYFSKRVPPDNFLYWFPWINDVTKYQELRQSSIYSRLAKVVYLGGLSFKNEPNFYTKLFPSITEGYNQAATEGKFSRIWIRK